MDFYSYQITVTRPAGQDGLGRSTGSAETIYDGPAEVQEQSVSKATQQGQVVRVGDAEGWLPEEEPFKLQPSDAVTVTRPDGSAFKATVADTTRLDRSFVLSIDR